MASVSHGKDQSHPTHQPTGQSSGVVGQEGMMHTTQLASHGQVLVETPPGMTVDSTEGMDQVSMETPQGGSSKIESGNSLGKSHL